LPRARGGLSWRGRPAHALFALGSLALFCGVFRKRRRAPWTHAILPHCDERVGFNSSTARQRGRAERPDHLPKQVGIVFHHDTVPDGPVSTAKSATDEGRTSDPCRFSDFRYSFTFTPAATACQPGVKSLVLTLWQDRSPSLSPPRGRRGRDRRVGGRSARGAGRPSLCCLPRHSGLSAKTSAEVQ